MKQNCLIEIGCEELPAHLVEPLSEKIANLLRDCFDYRQVSYQELELFSSPRRLAFIIKQMSATTLEKTIDKYGPYLEHAFDLEQKPSKAALGFASSCNVELQQLTTIKDSKGERLYFSSLEPGKNITEHLLFWIEQDVFRKLQGFKTMRWGQPGSFIRPVQWITGKFGAQDLIGELFTLKASANSYGHRFMSPGQLTISDTDKYLEIMRKNYVEPCAKTRTQAIIKQINDRTPKGLTAEIDQGLLAEVAQLVEWPVVLIGSFKQDFLRLPEAALRAVLHKHQRCFIMKHEDQLAANYIIISNIESTKPEQVIAGNNHVINARLADACFFYDIDICKTLEEHSLQLSNMVYQTGLGSLRDKISRLEHYSELFAELFAVDPKELRLSASLCKADLACAIVNELPEIQGKFAAHLARKQGISESVAKALASHRQALPSDALGRSLAIIDQLDHIIGFISIGLHPSGDKDPYALRRAASSVLNCILQSETRINLLYLVEQICLNLGCPDVSAKAINLVTERFTYWCRNNNISLSYLNAVEHLKSEGDVQKIAEILQSLSTETQISLIEASYKRLHNLTKKPVMADYSDLHLLENSEKTLYSAYKDFVFGSAKDEIAQLIQIAPKIDNMLDNVLVHTEDEILRKHRIDLLEKVKSLFLRTADFSKIY